MPTPSGFPTSQDLINAQKDVEHLGRVVNSEDAQGNPITSSTNRTGGTNKTLDALQAEYQSAIQAAGGVPLGTWAAGVTINAYNEYLVYNGVPYKPAASTSLPYTTQGSDPTVVPDAGNVVPFADVTRSDVVLNVSSISELLSVQPTGDGFKVNVTAYHDGWSAFNDSPKGGGVFIWESYRPKSEHNGGTVIDPLAPFPAWGDNAQVSTWFNSSQSGVGCWSLIHGTTVPVENFGAFGDANNDDRAAIQACLNAETSVTFESVEYYISGRVVTNQGQFVDGNNAILAVNGDYTGYQIARDSTTRDLFLLQRSTLLEGTAFLVNAGIDEVTGQDNGNIQAYQTENIEAVGFETAFRQVSNHPTEQRGIAYSKCHARRFFNCKYPYVIDTQGLGWVNDIEYENKLILNANPISGSIGILINNQGLEVNSHTFSGMSFERVEELILVDDTDASFNTAGIQIEGYFENVGFNNLDTYNEVFVTSTRNRHNAIEVYSGQRQLTRIAKGYSAKQGGEYTFTRVHTTDDGNTIGWEFSDSSRNDRFKIGEGDRFYHSGEHYDIKILNHQQTGDSFNVVFGGVIGGSLLVNVRIICTADDDDTLPFFYYGIASGRKNSNSYTLTPTTPSNTLTVTPLVSGGSFALRVDAPAFKYYRYQIVIDGDLFGFPVTIT